MARKKKHPEHVNHERWLVSYADFITLLFATFTALYAMSNADMEKFKAMAKSVSQAFSDGSSSVMKPHVTIDGGEDPGGPVVINIFPDKTPAPQPANEGEEEDLSGDPMSGILKGNEEGMGEDAQNRPGIESTPTTGPTPTPGPESQDQPPPQPSPTPDPALANMGKPEGEGNEALAAQIKEILDTAGLSGKVDVRQETRGMVISLGEAAFFAVGDTDVLPQCRFQLDKIVNALRGKSFEIRVEGHTDNTPIKSGRYRSNLELSTLRAARIVDFMAQEYKFPPQMLSSAGYGEWRPIADNSTAEGQQKNRRVDIVILNQKSASQEPH